MQVRLNGTPRQLADDATVANAVAAVAEVAEVAEGAPSAKGIAVAVNGEVIPRSRWYDVRLAADDRVEVLRAVGGG